MACGKAADPAEQFNVRKAEAKWNSTKRQWLELELRQLERGESLYNSFCAACHLSSGEGQLAMGAPALRDNAFARGAEKPLVRKVLFSSGSTMPPFAASLDDAQIAAILSYVRNAWGDQLGDPVKASLVAEVRQVGKSP
jgi:cytochrome c oxidase subunit 2